MQPRCQRLSALNRADDREDSLGRRQALNTSVWNADRRGV
jgi:hypothetical protein